MTDKKKSKNTNVNYSTIKSQLLNSAKNFSGMKWKFKGMKKLGKWQEEAEVKEKEKGDLFIPIRAGDVRDERVVIQQP